MGKSWPKVSANDGKRPGKARPTLAFLKRAATERHAPWTPHLSQRFEPPRLWRSEVRDPRRHLAEVAIDVRRDHVGARLVRAQHRSGWRSAAPGGQRPDSTWTRVENRAPSARPRVIVVGGVFVAAWFQVWRTPSQQVSRIGHSLERRRLARRYCPETCRLVIGGVKAAFDQRARLRRRAVEVELAIADGAQVVEGARSIDHRDEAERLERVKGVRRDDSCWRSPSSHPSAPAGSPWPRSRETDRERGCLRAPSRARRRSPEER
jgi:hypothetical protein